MSLYDTLRQIVRDELTRLHTAELAIVESTHPHTDDGDDDNYACTVRMRDSGLVLARVPVATPRIGAVSIPRPGESVLVQFLGGALDAPVITGCLYDDEHRPPPNADERAVLHAPPTAGESEAIHFELDSSEGRSMMFRLGAALEVKLADDDPVVEVGVDDGKATIRIDRDGKVAISSQTKIELRGGDLSLSGNEIEITASGTLTLKGATVNIN